MSRGFGIRVDLNDAESVAHVLERAAELMRRCPWRRGSTIHVPGMGGEGQRRSTEEMEAGGDGGGEGQGGVAGGAEGVQNQEGAGGSGAGVGWRVVMSGDLHDHVLNFQRLVKLARLEESKRHLLILHEICHGSRLICGCDFSVRLLAQVAALKCRWPEQVHVLLSNHDMAQALGQEILKEGRGMVQAFNDGLDYIFGPENAGRVRTGMGEFVRSLPLAVRLPNGILCTHSLPSPFQMEGFDLGVLDRELVEEDYFPGGAAYAMVWGRGHTAEQAERLAEAWGVELFVMGHQPVDMGYQVENDRMLVLASNHEHGVGLPIDTWRRYSMQELVEAIVPLAAVEI